MKGMTNRQQGFFIFLVVLAGATGTGGLPHGRDDWMAYLLLALLAVPLALFYRRFSGHPPLVQLREICGKRLGTVLALGYSLLGLLLASASFSVYTDFVVFTGLEYSTPWLNGLMLSVAAYSVLQSDLPGLGRLSRLIFSTVLVLLLCEIGIILLKARPENLFPLLENGGKGLPTIVYAGLALVAPPLFFTAFLGETREKPMQITTDPPTESQDPVTKTAKSITKMPILIRKKYPSGMRWYQNGLVVGSFFAILLVTVDSVATAMTLGDFLMQRMTYPAYTAMSVVELGKSFHHMELLVSGWLILTLPFRVCMYLSFAKRTLTALWPRGERWYPLLLVVVCCGLYLMTPAEDAWQRLADTRIWVIAATVGLPLLLGLLQRRKKRIS